MKQPELGRKIAELRKAKGLTQEELVDKCNISVRTLQRIETGEVTPRTYTVKTILAALGFDLGTITVDETDGGHSPAGWAARHLFLDVDRDTSVQFLANQLTAAWIAGVLYFFLGFFEGAADHFRYTEGRLIFSDGVYITMKLSVLIAYIFFQRGFLVLGGVFENYLLRIVSFLLIFGNVVTCGYDIASIFYDSTERGFVLGAEAFTFGGIGIVYGVSLLRLRRSVGSAAKYAGLFEIIAGSFFLTIILAFIGFFVLMPAELLQILILYKSIGIIASEHAPGREEAVGEETGESRI